MLSSASLQRDSRGQRLQNMSLSHVHQESHESVLLANVSHESDSAVTSLVSPMVVIQSLTFGLI